jgi:hypothetical protein
MCTRSLVLLSLVATCLTFAPQARADIPPGTTSASGASSSGSTTSGGAGGAGNNPTCTIAQESIAGSTCTECDPSSNCKSVGSDFNFVCQRTPNIQVWCNGPKRTTPSDSNVACSVSVPGGAWTGAAGAALAVAASLLMRRRSRRAETPPRESARRS